MDRIKVCIISCGMIANKAHIPAYLNREDAFFAAYHAIGQGARSRTLEGPYPWAERLGLVVDKYGIGWALYWNRPE